MNILIDKCILLLYCTLSLLFTPYNSAFVIALLTATTLGAFLYAFGDRRFELAGITLYSALLLILPEFGLFLPVILYHYLPDDYLAHRNPASLYPRIPACLLMAFGLLFRHSLVLRPSFLAFLLFGCALALLLRCRTASLELLRIKYRKTRDDDTEMQLLLEEKNQSLLEKQNSEIYAATLRERNRIAREIHDNVGHMLTRAILLVGVLKTIHHEAALDEPLSQLDTTLNQAMNSIRQSVHDLHDSSVNLRESLEALIRDFTFCPVALDYEMSPELPKELKYSLISITKEALVNIARHSNAGEARITAYEHPGFYQFIIQDNGSTASGDESVYLDPSAISGIGLANMRNRVRALNGSMRIQTTSGFRIHIMIPKFEKERGLTI